MTKPISPETVERIAVELIRQLGTSVTRAEVNRELSYRHGGVAHVNEATFDRLYESCFAEGCLADEDEADDDEPEEAEPTKTSQTSAKTSSEYGEKTKQMRQLFAELGFCSEKTFLAAARERGFTISSPTFYKNRKLLFDDNGNPRTNDSEAQPAQPTSQTHPLSKLAEIVEWAGGIKRLREMLDLIEQIRA